MIAVTTTLDRIGFEKNTPRRATSAARDSGNAGGTFSTPLVYFVPSSRNTAIQGSGQTGP